MTGKHESQRKSLKPTAPNPGLRFSKILPTQKAAAMQRVITRVTVVALFLSMFVALFVVLDSSPSKTFPAIQTATAEVNHKICPVENCSKYPVPGEIRGLTIATLQNWLLYVQSAESQIRAMHAWNDNTARLQIQQDRLITHGRVDHVYLHALRTIVHYALHHHKYVVLNAQTELSVGYWQNEPMPTHTTYIFWQTLIQFYGHNPHVILDLFNEPRDPHPWNGDWSEWRTKFQALVDYVRILGSRNQIWVEGENWGSTLQGVPLLRGQGIVYSFHHPGCPHPGACGGPKGKQGLTPDIWEQDFGYLDRRGIPLVDGEFVNYLGGYYWSHSTQLVTRYFQFLHYHHIGLVSWTLQPGIMTTSDPTVPMHEPISAGKLFMRYFHGTLFKDPKVLSEGEG